MTLNLRMLATLTKNACKRPSAVRLYHKSTMEPVFCAVLRPREPLPDSRIQPTVQRMLGHGMDASLIEANWTHRDTKSGEYGRPTRVQAEEAVRTLIRWAGDDPAREGLLDTPGRVV